MIAREICSVEFISAIDDMRSIVMRIAWQQGRAVLL